MENNIFFFWDNDDMPGIYRRNIEYVTIINPNHNVRILNDDDGQRLVREVSPVLADLFPKIMIPAVKSDIVRLAAIYLEGGWYSDCDTRLRTSIEYWDWPNKTLLLNWVKTRNKITVQNSFMGGKAGHPFFKRALSMIEELLIKKSAHFSVYRSTGPEAILQAAGLYIREETTDFREMDYTMIDVVGDETKGSWTFQECCGIWLDIDEPFLIRTDVAIGRIESSEALTYFKKAFALAPNTEAKNYKRLLLRAGIHYLHKLGNNDEICELSLKFVPRKPHAKYYNELIGKLSEQGDVENIKKLQ